MQTGRARVKSIICTTFFLVRLKFNEDFWCDRWMAGDNIVAKTKQVGSALHQAQLLLYKEKGESSEKTGNQTECSVEG